MRGTVIHVRVPADFRGLAVVPAQGDDAAPASRPPQHSATGNHMLHRIAAVAVVSIVSAGCQSAAPPPDPNVARLVDQQAIAQLIAGTYPNALDKADFDGYAALYTEDGELTLQGNTVKGRAAIKAFVAALPAEPRVIHPITNLSYTVNGDMATRSEERRVGKECRSRRARNESN